MSTLLQTHELRDRKGQLIGQVIEGPNGAKEARDRLGRLVGTYDPLTNQTHDREGHLVGFGDFLASLITATL